MEGAVLARMLVKVMSDIVASEPERNCSVSERSKRFIPLQEGRVSLECVKRRDCMAHCT